MRSTRMNAALLALLLACADGAAAQRQPQLVTPPRARRLPAGALNAVRGGNPGALPPTAQCAAYTPISDVSSQGGVLQTPLRMAPAVFRVGDSTYRRNVYNNLYNAPVLRMNRRETLRINVTNAMDTTRTASLQQIDTTNNHYHGMIVTPLPDTGDNVVPLVIPRGGSNLNNFWVPDLQSEGMMWYHPHPHGRTATQVAGGLAGALIIGDLLASYPIYRGATERVMYIKDTRNNPSTAYLNINENPCTALTIAPGERQLWRIGNFTAATWVNLKLGERGRNYRFIVLALDGNHLIRPTPMDSLFLAPGQRAEAIVIGGLGPWGTVAFYSDSFPTSFDTTTHKLKSWNPRVDLGTLTVTGLQQAVPRAAMEPGLQAPDAVLADSIRKLVVTADVDTFAVHFQILPGGLGLNGQLYDPTTLNRAVAVGRTQEWTLINDTWFLHTFHIHQTDFVVTRINGVDQPDSVHMDNVNLGIHQVRPGYWAGDTVVVRFKFNAIAAGPFVYHCHDLQHEDAGMMANICVYDPARGETPDKCRQWFPGGGSGHGHAMSHAAPAPAHAHPVRRE